jgi:hypothetical protein
MIKHVNKYTLIEGKKYYVKRKKGYLQILNKFECIFEQYNEEFEGFAWVIVSMAIPIELDLKLNEFYIHVSKEEYYAKVKEKYDTKCLNIILKRLIDESFQWN